MDFILQKKGNHADTEEDEGGIEIKSEQMGIPLLQEIHKRNQLPRLRVFPYHSSSFTLEPFLTSAGPHL